MMNVDQITSRLAKLPDQALQQYAAMHKNDPYVLSLAVAESNRRKQMRQAVQGAQGGQEQPKVADQAVADMAPEQLPENQGIARLPAGEMNFADGGIVAFAGGGDVERYQTGGIMAPSAVTPYAIPGMTIPATSRFAVPAAPGEDTIQRAIAAADAQSRQYTGLPLSDAQKQRIRAQFDQNFDKAAQMAPAAPAAPAAKPAAPAVPAAPAAAASAAPTGNVPDQRPAPAPAPAAAPRAPGVAPQAGLPAALQDPAKVYKDILAAQDYKDPAAKEVEELGRLGVEAAERRQKEFEDSVAKRGDVFKGREERLARREEELGKQKDTNTGLAFLNAGLAIMSTPGGLAQAIGKGARVGTEQFAAGLDKIRAAQERIEEARDKVEELRINRDDMTEKERRALSADIDKARMEARKLGIDGLRQAGQINRETAGKLLDATMSNARTIFEQQQANARNAASVAAQRNTIEQQVFPALVAKHKGDVAAAYQELITTKQDPKTDSSLVMEYAKNPAQLKVLEQTNPALAAMINARIQNMMLQDKPTGPVRP